MSSSSFLRAVSPAVLAIACSSAGTNSSAASSSSLQSQVQTASNTNGSAFALTPAMLEAQVLCTTSLTYHPCALVASGDTVNCFLLCQSQITAGAMNLAERGARECAALPPAEADAGSPACELQLADESPVDVAQLRAACNARCRALQADGG